MKTNFKLYLAACSVMAALGSCTQEAVIESAADGQDKATRAITLQAALGGDDSRIAFQEGETSIDLLWEENDGFSVIAGTAVQTPATFTLTEGAGTNRGQFAGEIACKDGDMLYAVWPKMENAMSDENQYYWSLDGQQGVLDDQYTFMVGQSQYKEGENIRMEFQYMTAALRMDISVPSGVEKIKQVQIKTGNDVYSGAFVSISSGNLMFDESTYGGITINKEIEVKDGKAQVVAYFFAWDNSSLSNTTVMVTDMNDVQYIGTLGDGSLRPGKLYDVSVQVMSLVNFDNEDDGANGSEDNPYEIANAQQFYSWMLRAQMDMQNEYGKNYRFCHYKLTQDIVLNNETTWYPFYFWNGSLDGQGHSISGNIRFHSQNNSGLFSLMEKVTVQNLILDLHVSFDDTDGTYDRFGVLAGKALVAEIINCVNHSDVEGNFTRMGGLVGCLDDSKMIACGNTGNLTSWAFCRRMGGITADLINNSLIEGCYNTGNFKVAAPYWEDGFRVGGIVGYASWLGDGAGGGIIIDEDAPADIYAVVKNCWSHSTLQVIQVAYNYPIHYGGIIGYLSCGTLVNGYWNDKVALPIDFIGGAANMIGGNSFAGDVPDAAHFAVMNASMSDLGWKFNEDGTAGKATGVIAPSMPKEEW